MEGLEPKPFGKRNFAASETLRQAKLCGKRNFEAGEASTEYPFLMKFVTSAENVTAKVRRPDTHFAQADSLRCCRIAPELLSALPALDASVAAWQVLLPARL